MSEVVQKARRVLARALGNLKWQQVEHFDPAWTKRIQEMAKFVPEGSSVLDLGCGKMWLRQFLTNSRYYPVDYTDRGEGIIVCDFNDGEFPQVKADVAFVSGTLEYVEDTHWFVTRIAAACNRCVLSYCVMEDYPDLRFRRGKAWVNDYPRADILNLFSAAGFRLQAESDAIPRNRIFCFVRE